MFPLLTTLESRSFDRAMIDAGIPGIVLMENAARGAYDVIQSVHRADLGRVVVVGGTGNNGGDAWALARRLLTHGHNPQVFLAGEGQHIKGDARSMLDALRALDVAIHPLESGTEEPFRRALARATITIDGIFGTGLTRPVSGWHLNVVNALNDANAPVVSLDLPSGLMADTGAVHDGVVRATTTVTFGGHKRGLWLFPGRTYAGQVHCVDIGVPPPTGHGSILEQRDLLAMLPSRPLNQHKGRSGHIVICGGSQGKTGAAILSGWAALRAGAGLVTLASDAATVGTFEEKVVELMTYVIADSSVDQGFWKSKAAAVLGPGFGLSDAKQTQARTLALNLPCPTVIDADALSAWVDHDLNELREAAAPRILTPHPGEAARLLNTTPREVQAKRFETAETLAQFTGQTVVLKGAATLIMTPEGQHALSPFAVPALSIPGSGDVLAGIIATLCATLSPSKAAFAGVLWHALAGRHAATGDRGLVAREIADACPAVREALVDGTS